MWGIGGCPIFGLRQCNGIGLRYNTSWVPIQISKTYHGKRSFWQFFSNFTFQKTRRQGMFSRTTSPFYEIQNAHSCIWPPGAAFPTQKRIKHHPQIRMQYHGSWRHREKKKKSTHEMLISLWLYEVFECMKNHYNIMFIFTFPRH